MKPAPVTIRPATASDVAAVVRVVNNAYEVEGFFVSGDRTDAKDVHALMGRGTFYVACDADGVVGGSVFTEVTGDRGYFGMLAVAPSLQGHGVGQALVDRAELHARDAGCGEMTITVVNLRTDLLGFYGRRGYVETGRAPYVHRPILQPCEFICFRKIL